ncbi:MAG: hypothetical protein HUU22_03785 [Phycisphaerae bacterium]|nr:hypothetical protein [Phycisphaerae bacterium]NUQ45137.1 hypothetical protein [Phycisphaerae bacterium]
MVRAHRDFPRTAVTILIAAISVTGACIRVNRPVLDPVPDPQWTTLPAVSPPAEPPASRRALLRPPGAET